MRNCPVKNPSFIASHHPFGGLTITFLGCNQCTLDPVNIILERQTCLDIVIYKVTKSPRSRAAIKPSLNMDGPLAHWIITISVCSAIHMRFQAGPSDSDQRLSLGHGHPINLCGVNLLWAQPLRWGPVKTMEEPSQSH